MFLTLNHHKRIVYEALKEFVLACYQFSKQLPGEERFGMASQIKRAALSVHLNIAEGCSRKSEAERKRYFEISRGSLIEIDAAFDIAEKLNYFINYNNVDLSASMIKCFRLLSGLIKVQNQNSQQIKI